VFPLLFWSASLAGRLLITEGVPRSPCGRLAESTLHSLHARLVVVSSVDNLSAGVLVCHTSSFSWFVWKLLVGRGLEV